MKATARSGFLLAPVVLCSCTHMVPVVPEAISCKIDDSLLAACSTPEPIAVGLSYGDLLRSTRSDREHLDECRLRHDRVRDAVQACNEKLVEYNAKIKAINSSAASSVK